MICLTRYEYSTLKGTVSGGRTIRGPEKRKEERLVFKACEVGKIRLGDQKGGNTLHDPWCNRRRKQCQKLPKSASYVPESRVVR